ncbi:hypothetical protein [Streptomyces bauhiniae]
MSEEIVYVRGDATVPCAEGARVIAHVRNDIGGWGRGFVIELGASVHTPRIGCGLAGGEWPLVEPLVAGRLAGRGIPVTVYDHGEGA